MVLWEEWAEVSTVHDENPRALSSIHISSLACTVKESLEIYLNNRLASIFKPEQYFEDQTAPANGRTVFQAGQITSRKPS